MARSPDIETPYFVPYPVPVPVFVMPVPVQVPYFVPFPVAYNEPAGYPQSSSPSTVEPPPQPLHIGGYIPNLAPQHPERHHPVTLATSCPGELHLDAWVHGPSMIETAFVIGRSYSKCIEVIVPVDNPNVVCRALFRIRHAVHRSRKWGFTWEVHYDGCNIRPVHLLLKSYFINPQTEQYRLHLCTSDRRLCAEMHANSDRPMLHVEYIRERSMASLSDSRWMAGAMRIYRRKQLKWLKDNNVREEMVFSNKTTLFPRQGDTISSEALMNAVLEHSDHGSDNEGTQPSASEPFVTGSSGARSSTDPL